MQLEKAPGLHRISRTMLYIRKGWVGLRAFATIHQPMLRTRTLHWIGNASFGS